MTESPTDPSVGQALPGMPILILPVAFSRPATLWREVASAQNIQGETLFLTVYHKKGHVQH